MGWNNQDTKSWKEKERKQKEKKDDTTIVVSKQTSGQRAQTDRERYFLMIKGLIHAVSPMGITQISETYNLKMH
jgi:hypothetical protein